MRRWMIQTEQSFPANGKGPDRLYSVVVIYEDIAIEYEGTTIRFLMNTVSKGFFDGAVMGDLIIFSVYPRKISVNFPREGVAVVFADPMKSECRIHYRYGAYL